MGEIGGSEGREEKGEEKGLTGGVNGVMGCQSQLSDTHHGRRP
jgi:hypothetical protein